MLSRIIKKSFSTAGQLFTWGPTTYGWARPVNKHIWTPAPAKVTNNIVSVSTGETHLGYITQDNQVFVCGLEDGFSNNSETPRQVTFQGNPTISALSCGNHHTLALTSEGAVYTWGSAFSGVANGTTPVRIPQQYFGNDKVISIAAGRHFSVALCDKGHVYTWGAGLVELPDWQSPPPTETPVQSEQIKELCEKKHAHVVKIAAVEKFILVLLDDGRIYCRGMNNGGVFGARQNPFVLSDIQLKTFMRTHDELYKGQKIVDFECSSNALIFRTESGRIFFNGMFYAWQPTPFPIEVQAKSIFATDSSVGVVADNGKVYYLNERIIEDSQYVNKSNRVYVVQDAAFEKGVLGIGGNYHLKYALLK